MKIAYLSTFYPLRGGVAQFNANLYEVFQLDNEIRAYTFKRQYPKLLFPGSSQIVSDSDKAKYIDSIPILDTLNPISFLKTANVILRFKPDLLIMKYWMPYFGLSLGTVAKKLRKKGVKTIAILDNVIPHEKRRGNIYLTKYFLNRNDGFVVMSETVRKDLLSLKPNAKYIFHPHPIYDHYGIKEDLTTSRNNLNIPVNKKVILFFGFIREYKGLDILIETMNYLSDDYLLIIAGEVYGSFDKYQNIIDKYSLQNKIQLHTKYISDNEVPLYFSAADVLVLPYKSATQSGIIGISHHFDLPVISSDAGGLREMVKDGQTGFVVNNPELGKFAEVIKKYFAENKKEEFSRNIREEKSKYSWKSFADGIIELYKKLKS